MELNLILGLFNLGGGEITIIVVVVLLFFGGKKIPELAKGIGSGIRNFKDAYKDGKSPEEGENDKKKIE